MNHMGVLLLGARGCGKTSLGREVARALGWQFVDLDVAITEAAVRSIAEIFAAEGEAGFRHRESVALAEALKLIDAGAVISLGGGTIVSESNRKLIHATDCPKIYLRCDPVVLSERIRLDSATPSARPNLLPDSRGADDLLEIRQVLSQREALYREAMTHEVDVSILSREEGAEAILSCLRR